VTTARAQPKNAKGKMQKAKLRTQAAQEDGPAFRILRFACCISNF
jgi:hypothetical protein